MLVLALVCTTAAVVPNQGDDRWLLQPERASGFFSSNHDGRAGAAGDLGRLASQLGLKSDTSDRNDEHYETFLGVKVSHDAPTAVPASRADHMHRRASQDASRLDGSASKLMHGSRMAEGLKLATAEQLDANSSKCMGRALYMEMSGLAVSVRTTLDSGVIEGSVTVLALIAVCSLIILLFGEYFVRPALFIVAGLASFILLFQLYFYLIDGTNGLVKWEECYAPLVISGLTGILFGLLVLFLLPLAAFVTGGTIGSLLSSNPGKWSTSHQPRP